jgi:hypothetical protein
MMGALLIIGTVLWPVSYRRMPRDRSWGDNAPSTFASARSSSPERNDLLFERFVSEERREPPDIGDDGTAAATIPIPSGVRVWIATGHTDMRYAWTMIDQLSEPGQTWPKRKT